MFMIFIMNSFASTLIGVLAVLKFIIMLISIKQTSGLPKLRGIRLLRLNINPGRNGIGLIEGW
jgi:hypothetical protein